MNPYSSLFLGIICAGVGGELFVRGSVGLARQLRVSSGIIGATFAAFATSAPELSVGLQSALAGEPQISLGDAIGSNIVNIALILGLALSFAPISCSRETVRHDFPVALLAPVAVAATGFDGVISRLDGALLLGAFASWLILTAKSAKQQYSAAGSVLGARGASREIAQGTIGLGLLALAGNRIVAGASSIATEWGMNEFQVGATIVAIGTSVPELATVLISKYRGHEEVGLGTALGSNIFNGLFIVGIAACIHPIGVNWREIDAAVSLGAIAIALSWPSKSGVIVRGRGPLLLVIYIAHIWTATRLVGQR